MSRPSQSVSNTYTTAQSGVVLLDAAPLVRYVITGVIFTAHALTVANPLMSVSLGGVLVAKHPGVPAGGGLVAMGMNVTVAQGSDVTFDCEAPTSGSVTVTVFYRVD